MIAQKRLQNNVTFIFLFILAALYLAPMLIIFMNSSFALSGTTERSEVEGQMLINAFRLRFAPLSAKIIISSDFPRSRISSRRVLLIQLLLSLHGWRS